VVTRVKKNSICVALNKDDQITLSLHRLDLVADEVSFRRMTAALERLGVGEEKRGKIAIVASF